MHITIYLRDLNRRRAVKVAVVPRQEYQVSLEVLVPRDQPGSRDRSARKDPWGHAESEAMMANQEAKAFQVPRDLQGR